MELTGFLIKLADYANDIDMGRKGLATDGEEHKGRISYERGISGSLASFRTAGASKEPQTIILSELVFLQQELRFCHETDTRTQSSLTQAIQSFEDALRCLKIVEDANAYKFAEATHSTAMRYRIQGYPKDAFHLACASHWTRLQNVLRAPGINMNEKAVLQQRADNMNAVQRSYIQMQRMALGG